MEVEHKYNVTYQRNLVHLNEIPFSIPLTSQETRRQNHGCSKLSCFQEVCQSWRQEDRHCEAWDQEGCVESSCYLCQGFKSCEPEGPEVSNSEDPEVASHEGPEDSGHEEPEDPRCEVQEEPSCHEESFSPEEDWGQGDQEDDWEEGQADDDQGRPWNCQEKP